jgi:hypothetical protein
MNKYAETAVNAISYIKDGTFKIPQEAWDKAVSDIFPHSKSSREKGCPRNAFLGLCELGLISGVPSGNYTKSILNKKYASDAVQILKNNSALADDKYSLWDMVKGEGNKAHNHQMDIVTTLWSSGLIEAN